MKVFRKFALLALPLLLVAADAPTSQPAPKLGEPVDLLAGDGLAHWSWIPGKTKAKLEDVWTLKDGVLHCAGKPTGYLRTTAKYESYVMHLKMRHLSKGNGGILLRVVGDDKVWPKSIQVQGERGTVGDLIAMIGFPMKTDAARTDSKMKEKTVRMHPEIAEPAIGEWSDLEILLNGPDLKVTLNGTLQNEAHECDVVEGFIGIQAEGAECEFKELTLTPIVK